MAQGTITRRAALGTAGAGIIAAPMLSSNASAQETHSFRMATAWPGGPLMEIGAKAFAERLEFLSEGRIKVQVFPGGALGNALKVSDTVRNGVAEMGHTGTHYDWGAETATVPLSGYAGGLDTELMLHWLYEGDGLELQRRLREETAGIISMPLFIRPAEVFLQSRKPVRNLEDLKGLKLRTSGAWLEISRRVGASPVMMAGGEVYTALERGVIDATEWGTLWENLSPGFYKVAKYVIIPGAHSPTGTGELVINKDAWARLGPRDQKLVEFAAKLVTLDSWMRVGQEDAKSLDAYRQAGNEIIDLAPEAQCEIKRIALEWAREQADANPRFKEILESQLAFEELWKDADRYRSLATCG